MRLRAPPAAVECVFAPPPPAVAMGAPRPLARVYTYDSGLDVSTAASAQASMPEDDFNAPYARKAAILAGLGLVNGAPPPASTPRVHAELVRVTCAAERAECTLTPDESAGVVTLALDIVPDGGLDLALGAHESGLVRYLETAWDRWARLPPSARCRFFRRPMPPSPSPTSSSSSVPALVPSNFCARHERASREPGSGVHAQTCFYHTDDETPVFKALLPSLVADVAVVNRVRVELQRDLSFILGGGGGGGGPASRLRPPRRAYHYALVTHPGHHAGGSSVGGYCYLNNAAILARSLLSASDDPDDDDPDSVASSLATISRVAILDVDYHFGNGTASIFWDDPDVFFASVHADTEGDYPWCGGRASDAGGGRGQGKTLCEPLPRGATWDAEYKPALARALAAIARHDPSVLVVSLGLDAHEADPVQERATAGIALTLAEYREMGRMIGECAAGKGSNGEGGTVVGGGGCSATTPVAFVQEGGYDAEHAGAIVAETFRGFEEGFAADEWERGDDAEVIAREVFAKVVIARGGRSGGGGAGGEEGGKKGGVDEKRDADEKRRDASASDDAAAAGEATRRVKSPGPGSGGSAGATKEAKEASGAAGTPARGGAPAKAPEREGAAAAAAAAAAKPEPEPKPKPKKKGWFG